MTTLNIRNLANEMAEDEAVGPSHPLTEAVESLAEAVEALTVEGWDADTADHVVRLLAGTAEDLASYAGGDR